MVALLILAGLKDLIFEHGFVPDMPPAVQAVQPLGWFLILRAFSSGCSAMTGIESIANGVKVFQEPAVVNARRTLLVMGVLLAAMFLAVSGLGYIYIASLRKIGSLFAKIYVGFLFTIFRKS